MQFNLAFPLIPNRSRYIANFCATPIFVQRQFLTTKYGLNDLNGDQFGELGMPDLTTIYM
jgi:hypothetical protein